MLKVRPRDTTHEMLLSFPVSKKAIVPKINVGFYYGKKKLKILTNQPIFLNMNMFYF